MIMMWRVMMTWLRKRNCSVWTKTPTSWAGTDPTKGKTSPNNNSKRWRMKIKTKTKMKMMSSTNITKAP